jgi:phosphate acetyltransferase
MELALEEKINAFIHGPLAFDNAVSEEAATIKGIKNDVAGDADILLVPNLETGNSLSKIMVYFMNACAAGIVIGGKVPVVVPSRADSKNSKLASIMAAVVAANN